MVHHYQTRNNAIGRGVNNERCTRKSESLRFVAQADEKKTRKAKQLRREKEKGKEKGGALN